MALKRQVFNKVFELSEQGIWIAKPDGVTLQVNAKMAKMLGYSQEEIVGKVGTSFLAEGQEPLVKQIRSELNANIRQQREMVFRCKDQTLLWTIVNTTPIFDHEGNHVANLAMHTDITERKKTEDQLELYAKDLEKIVEERTRQLKKSERLSAIGATAAMVGHDIRNPLQAIINDVYLLKDEVEKSPACKANPNVVESLDSIEKNICYINKIVADLQDFSRALKPDFSTVNLYECVVNSFKTINLPKEISCQIVVDPKITVWADSTFLNRILINLVINAIEAMPAGGKLEISGQTQGKNLLIEVADTGVGISDEVKEKLFTPMVTNKAKGQGLGLAVVKRLVEALDGSIICCSEVGLGTKFSVTIPQKPPAT